LNLPSIGDNDGHKTNDSKPISSDNLRQAFEKGLSSMIGVASLKSLIAALEERGIDLNNPSSSYDLKMLEIELAMIFGQAATKLLIERINQELDSQNQ